MAWTPRRKGWLNREEQRVAREEPPIPTQTECPIINLPNKDLFTPEEAAFWLQVSKATIYRWINEKFLIGIKINRTVRIQRAALLKILSYQSRPS